MVAGSKQEGKLSFWRKYVRFCRAAKVKPICKSAQGLLSLNADSLGLHDWKPFLRALSADRSLDSISISSHQPLTKFAKKFTHLLLTGKIGPVLESVDSETKVKREDCSVVGTLFMMRCLSEALHHTLSATGHLRELHLNRLWVKGEILQLLCQGLLQNQSLLHLSLEHCPISDEGCEILCRAVSSHVTLIDLELVNCNITFKGAAHITRLIQRQDENKGLVMGAYTIEKEDTKMRSRKGLKRLNIGHNPNINDSGLTLLVQALEFNESLKFLQMRNCGLTEFGGEMVASLVSKNRTILEFDLNQNPGITPRIIDRIKRALDFNSQFNIKLAEQYEEKNDLISSANNSLNKRLEAMRKLYLGDQWSLEPEENPFARINPTSLETFVKNMRKKNSYGKPNPEIGKSAYQKILDGTVQDLYCSMEPGSSEEVCSPVMTRFGNAANIKVRDFITQVVPRGSRGRRYFSNSKSLTPESRETPRRIKKCNKDVMRNPSHLAKSPERLKLSPNRDVDKNIDQGESETSYTYRSLYFEGDMN